MNGALIMAGKERGHALLGIWYTDRNTVIIPIRTARQQ